MPISLLLSESVKERYENIAQGKNQPLKKAAAQAMLTRPSDFEGALRTTGGRIDIPTRHNAPGQPSAHFGDIIQAEQKGSARVDSLGMYRTTPKASSIGAKVIKTMQNSATLKWGEAPVTSVRLVITRASSQRHNAAWRICLPLPLPLRQCERRGSA